MPVRVQSDSDPSIIYLVDPVEGTCSCQSSQRLQSEGKGRVCKHVQRVWAQGEQPSSEESPAPPSDVSLVLAHPDPDFEDIPEKIPEEAIATIDIAARILRAVKKGENSIGALTARKNDDLRAWDALISVEQAKVNSLKATIKGWMERNKIPQIHTPFFTHYIRKGNVSLVLDDEEAVKRVAKANYPKAIETVEQFVWKELRVLFDTFPQHFKEVKDEKGETVIRPQIAHEEKADSILVSLPRKQK